MNIPKAIEILDLNIRQRAPDMPLDVLAALKLGKEALKAILAERIGQVIDYRHPLPGED